MITTAVLTVVIVLAVAAILRNIDDAKREILKAIADRRKDDHHA